MVQAYGACFPHLGNDSNCGSPLFIAGGIGAWSWTPSDLAELAPMLGDPGELVLANTFFDLLNRVL